MHSLVALASPSPFSGAERRDVHLDVEHCTIVQRLRPYPRFPWSEHGDEHLRQTVRDHCRTVCRAALREIHGYLAQLVLPAAVRAVPVIVENFDTRGL